MKYKIVACIPAKNEDYIIDDNSTDDTQLICKKYEKVDLLIRPIRDPRDRQGALQRQELLDKAYEYDPDYFFL